MIDTPPAVDATVDVVCTTGGHLSSVGVSSTESHTRHLAPVDARGQRCGYRSAPYAGTRSGCPQSTGPTIPTYFMTSLYGDKGRSCEIPL
jgi:hypothetical protein